MRPAWPSVWGVFGVLALLVEAILRLAPAALEPLRAGTLTFEHGLAYVGIVVFFGVVEGYRGFQRAFSPRAAARAVWLDRETCPLSWRLLAPLFCMALIVAAPRRLVINWLLVGGIVGLIYLVRLLPSPWRALVDGGVVVGLSWGAVSLLVFYRRALQGNDPGTPLELPAP